MLIVDVLLAIALLTFCAAWLLPALPARDLVLSVAAGGAAVIAFLYVLDGRWQAATAGMAAVGFVAILAVRRARNRPVPSTVPFWSGAALAVLAVVALFPLYMIPVFELPPTSGPHQVGVRDFELSDDSRLGVLYAEPDEPRRLSIRVWYPAASTENFSRRPYATDAELETTYPWLAKEEMDLPSFFYSHLKYITTHAYDNAPVLEDAQALPVVFFSHGLFSYVSQNTALMEHLASRGYVVFSIGHPYDAAPLLYPNGDVIELPPGLRQEANESPEPSAEVAAMAKVAGPQFTSGRTYEERFQGAVGQLEINELIDDRFIHESPGIWLADHLFAVEALATGPVPESISDIIDHADLTRVAHMGMSYGGSTAAAAAYLDPRCVAAINLDGSDFHNNGMNADIPVPFLMLYSDSIDDYGSVEEPSGRPFGYNDLTYERYETAGQREDVVRLHVRGSTHLGISDTQLMLRGPLHSMLAGSIDGDRMIQILNGFVGDFLDKYMRDIDNGFPDDNLAAYGEVVAHDVSGVSDWWNAKTPQERRAAEQAIERVRPPAGTG